MKLFPQKTSKIFPYLFIFITVLFFFKPVFFGNIPFPGDLLVSQSPYKAESYLGYAPGGYPNKAQGPDVINEIYPWKYFSIEQLKKGELPLWNPYNFSGNPQMANFQTAIFYPLNILYLILPFNLAWTIYIASQPFLAAIFMFLFLRKSLFLNTPASLMGAISFGFSSYMTVWLQYGNIGSAFLWLPLALFFTKDIIIKISLVSFLGLVISLAGSLLAGYIQGSFYVFLIVFSYFLFLMKGRKDKFKKIFYFFGALLIPVLIASVQIIPTLELFANSTRSSYSQDQIKNLLLPTYYWITLFSPDFFGNPATQNYWIDGTYIERVLYAGIVPLFFAIYGVSKIKMKETYFFLLLAILAAFFSTGLPFISEIYRIPIPVISTTIPTRQLSIFIFAISVLASIGINHFIFKKDIKSKIPFLFGLIFILIFTGAFLFSSNNLISSDNFKIAARNMVIPGFLFIVTVFSFYFFKRLKIISLVLIFLVLIFDFLYFFNKITPFSPNSFTYSDTAVISFLKKHQGIDRYWGYGSAYVPANFQSVDGTFSPEGNDPLHIKSYGQLLASSGDGRLPKTLPRPDANIAPGFGQEDLRENKNRQKLLNLLSIKYVIHQKISESPDTATFPEEKYKLAWQDKSWQVYENKFALPRFFIANDFVVVKSEEEALSLIYDDRFDPSKKIILFEHPKVGIAKNSNNEIKLEEYRPNKIVFKAKSSENGLLFLSDNYYPGWRATVNGNETKIFKANYSFRSIVVPKGENSVVFEYKPESFELGKKVSLIGFLLVPLFMLKIKNEK